MLETSTPTDYEEASITERNLLQKIWFHPTATLRFILANCPDKYILTLLVLGGIVRAIDRATKQHQGDTMSTTGVLLLALVGGGLFGWATYLLYAWGMRVTGQWLGGRSDYDTFRIVLAWALVPSITTLLFLVPEVAVFGDSLFKSDLEIHSLASRTLAIASGLAQLVLSIWTFVILLRGIMLVQNFSVGRALANMLLPGGLVVGVILALVMIFKVFEKIIG